MLKTNNQLNHPLIGVFILISGFFLFQYLTFIPEYSSAESIETPIYSPDTEIRTLANINSMDEITPEICGNTPLADTEGHHQYPLKDPRDGQTYTVAKLEDGNCWMTQNMNNPTGRTNTSSTYGGYYNWDNAISVCSDIDGWSLPTKDQYTNLTNDGTMSVSTAMNLPFNLKLGGSILTSGQIGNAGNIGSYWSSTSDGTYDGAYNLYFNRYDTTVKPAMQNSHSWCYSVRCVATGNGNINPPDIKPEIDNPNISVSIPNIITLDVSDSVDITTKSDEVNTGTFTAKVTSNQDYSISLNAAGDSTSLINSKDGSNIAEIPTITTTQPTPGISSWGIRTCSDLDTSSCTELYKPLPAKNITNTFLSGTSGIHQHLFQIGVSTSPNLPSGTYSTNILVTASQ